MTESSYKYDTAGWHLLHTDNDGNFITGDDAVTISTGDIGVGGLWKLTANGENEFARIPNGVALTSANWEAGELNNILPNTVYWVYTGRIEQAAVSLTNIALGVTTIPAGASGDANVENGGELNRNSYIAKFLKTDSIAGDIIYVFNDGYNTNGGTTREAFTNGLDDFLSIRFQPNQAGSTTIQMKTYSGSPIENAYLYALFITVNATLATDAVNTTGIPQNSENFTADRDRGTYAINTLNDNTNDFSIVSFETDDIQYMNPIITSEYTNIFLEDSITITTSVE